MSATCNMIGLLAAATREEMLRALQDGFRNPPSFMDTPTLLAVLAGLCVVVWLLARMAEPRSQATVVARVDYLSRSLELLNLSRSECNDVQTVARHAGLPHPAAMLLSPANLAHAARLALNTHADPELGSRLSRLALKLYGAELPGPPTDAQPQ